MPTKYLTRPGIWMVRAVCVCSWVVVTALLLVPDPSALVGMRRVPLSGYSTAAHIGSFILLSVLTLASRLPLSMTAALAVLVSYGAVVELLQWFVPRRTVSFGDFVANALGIAVGAGAYAVAEWYRRRHTLRS